MWFKVKEKDKSQPLLMPFGPSTVFIEQPEEVKIDEKLLALLVKQMEQHTGKKIRDLEIKYAIVNWKYE